VNATLPQLNVTVHGGSHLHIVRLAFRVSFAASTTVQNFIEINHRLLGTMAGATPFFSKTALCCDLL
jgi:hypothetical protein